MAIIVFCNAMQGFGDLVSGLLTIKTIIEHGYSEEIFFINEDAKKLTYLQEDMPPNAFVISESDFQQMIKNNQKHIHLCITCVALFIPDYLLKKYPYSFYSRIFIS